MKNGSLKLLWMTWALFFVGCATYEARPAATEGSECHTLNVTAMYPLPDDCAHDGVVLPDPRLLAPRRLEQGGGPGNRRSG